MSAQTRAQSLLISGVELPAPSKGYKTLDVLGSATSTTITKGQSPEQIASAIKDRLLLELGLWVPEFIDHALEKLEHIIADEPIIEGVQNLSILFSKHVIDRTVKEGPAEGRPSLHEAVRAVERGKVATGQDGALLHSDGTTVAVTRGRLLITAFKKFRIQLVLLFEGGPTVQFIEAHHDELKSTVRNPTARAMGSGICDLMFLDADRLVPILQDEFSPSEWAGGLISESTKEYSQIETSINTGGINPDFHRLYFKRFGAKLVESLADSSGAEPLSDRIHKEIPPLFWAGETAVTVGARISVVFVTAVIPASAHMKKITGPGGCTIVSIAKTADSHSPLPVPEVPVPPPPAHHGGGRWGGAEGGAGVWRRGGHGRVSSMSDGCEGRQADANARGYSGGGAAAASSDRKLGTVVRWDNDKV